MTLKRSCQKCKNKKRTTIQLTRKGKQVVKSRFKNKNDNNNKFNYCNNSNNNNNNNSSSSN